LKDSSLKGPVPLAWVAGLDVAGTQRVVRLHPFLAHDVDAGEIVQQQGIGAPRDDVDGVLADFLRPDHRRQIAARAGAGIQNAGDGGDHVIRVEGVAVMELHALAQLEAPAIRGGVGPADRQRRLQLQRAAAPNQRVEHVMQHARGEALGMRIWVHAHDVGRRRPAQRLRRDLPRRDHGQDGQGRDPDKRFHAVSPCC
jgi:hypothetical protein